VDDNVNTLQELLDISKSLSLTYALTSPTPSKFPNLPILTQTLPPADSDVLFILKFSTPQRNALLTSPSTRAMLYTPSNEHFGIVPVEGMVCGVPVLACDTGGPTESICSTPPSERTGWLCPPDPDAWAEILGEILNLSEVERKELGERGKERARRMFSMKSMAREMESALEDAVKMGRVEHNFAGWVAFVIGVFGLILAAMVYMVVAGTKA
jgi:alpha-1,3/alpha-1,6-mannosyltransferase